MQVNLQTLKVYAIGLLALGSVLLIGGTVYTFSGSQSNDVLLNTSGGACPVGGIDCSTNTSNPRCQFNNNPIGFGCAYGEHPNHINAYAHEGKDPDPKCNADNTYFLDVTRVNPCNYIHEQVCVGKVMFTSAAQGNLCSYSADWECCNWAGTNEEKATKVILTKNSEGQLEPVLERDFYSGTGVDGRLEGADCSVLRGWMGAKSDFRLQPNVFFTVGGPVGEGEVFNPEVRADLPGTDGSLICDFLDNKSDGPIQDCQNCTGTACNHRFEIDLSEYTDSAVFNGKAGNKIYAYGVDEGKAGNLLKWDGKTDHIVIDEVCGDTWDGESDNIPQGASTQASGQGSSGATGSASGGASSGGGATNCGQSADFTFDGVVNVNDVSTFASHYQQCAKDKSSSACVLGDLTCDDLTDIFDFTELVNQLIADNS